MKRLSGQKGGVNRMGCTGRVGTRSHLGPGLGEAGVGSAREKEKKGRVQRSTEESIKYGEEYRGAYVRSVQSREAGDERMSVIRDGRAFLD